MQFTAPTASEYGRPMLYHKIGLVPFPTSQAAPLRRIQSSRSGYTGHQTDEKSLCIFQSSEHAGYLWRHPSVSSSVGRNARIYFSIPPGSSRPGQHVPRSSRNDRRLSLLCLVAAWWPATRLFFGVACLLRKKNGLLDIVTLPRLNLFPSRL